MTDLGTIDEKSTPDYTATLKDSATGLAIASSQLLSLTLTLYSIATGTIINSRENQNIINANNVTFHATSGLLTWAMQVADTTLAGTAKRDRRRAVFVFTWNRGGDAKRDTHTIEFTVVNEPKVI